MQRRKPASAKQRKAKLQLKRAVKRGDVPLPDKGANHRKSNSSRSGPTGKRLGSAGDTAVIASSRRLQSSFITLPPHFLEETKTLASTLPLLRPVAPVTAVLDNLATSGGQCDSLNTVKAEQLTCPRRPKWRYDMTKKEVEKNEEGIFNKWLAQTDSLVAEWLESEDKNYAKDQARSQVDKMPRSPTYFERNLEVWRQLWRVTEISQILLVLLDSRCPLMHYPPSLSTFLSDRNVILILTKVDISGPVRADAWTNYLRTHYPGLRIVQVEAYVEKEASEGQQGRMMYQPHLPEGFRERLVVALRELHAEMMVPPDKVRTNAIRLKSWRPPVKKDIDWEAVLSAGGGKVGSFVGGPAVPRPKDDGDDFADSPNNTDQEPEFLTIGLIGQPNVGKSSLLNALFNTHKVRASKTPGKTKHFQTLFWTSDVRLVDCPGIVMPNLVPLEMQVLCGILPISRISAIPSCIHYVAQLLPLEQIYNLVHPSLASPPVEDKRTWRSESRPSNDKNTEVTWTAMDILTAFARFKGWVTAKAGRPDVHRAGNAILRALSEGRIGWAFWPPSTAISTVMMNAEPGAGIWAPHIAVQDEEYECESEDNEEEQPGMSSGSEDGLASESSEVVEDGSEIPVPVTGIGRFSALSLEADNEDSWSDEQEVEAGY